MTRRMMDGQRFHNYAASATAESIASQPKAPFIVPLGGIEGFEGDWAALSSGNPSHLVYNHVDEAGNPIPAPVRLAPPSMSQGFASLLEYSSASMESSVGMFKANLGQQDNASSGRAIRARQQEGDTANFHYIDNRDRAVEQLGRVVVDMIPKVYDTQRQARILGDDGKQDFVQIDPSMPQAVQKDGRKVVAINLNVGAYDVRVKSGPSFSNNRQEAAQQIVELSQGNPQLQAMMAPLLMKLQDLPDSEKAYRVMLASLPPAVQEAYGDDEGEDIPPIAAAKIQSLQAELQQCQQALQEASQEADGTKAKNDVDQYKAVTDRLTLVMPFMTPVEQFALAEETFEDAGMEPPVMLPGAPPEGMEPGGPPEPMPEMGAPEQPPPGGFSLPEQQQ
jgi:hypothetical protein